MPSVAVFDSQCLPLRRTRQEPSVRLELQRKFGLRRPSGPAGDRAGGGSPEALLKGAVRAKEVVGGIIPIGLKEWE